jgi:hypothetical protein
MKAIYWLRVVFVSPEALILVCALLAVNNFASALDELAKSVAFNDEILKYLQALPSAVAVWVFNEGRQLLIEDKETIRVLTAWPDYWKLKAHVFVALFFALVFAAVSIAPWLFRSGIGVGAGILLFLTGIVGQLFVAASVYNARLRVKEYVANAGAA